MYVHITDGHIYRLPQTKSLEVISFEDYKLNVADSKQTLIGLDMSFNPIA
jgi:hypothetical protein